MKYYTSTSIIITSICSLHSPSVPDHQKRRQCLQSKRTGFSYYVIHLTIMLLSPTTL